MNFQTVFTIVRRFLDEHGWDHAVIGGHALAAYGLARATFDLDLAVPAESQDELIEFLETSGYETLYRSSGFSNHLHPNPELGRIDFVYVRDETAKKLFANTVERPSFAETVRLASAEHLVAMKVAAIKNDPERKFQDLADIAFLLKNGLVELDTIQPYFARHELEELLRELTQSF